MAQYLFEMKLYRLIAVIALSVKLKEYAGSANPPFSGGRLVRSLRFKKGRRGRGWALRHSGEHGAPMDSGPQNNNRVIEPEEAEMFIKGKGNEWGQAFVVVIYCKLCFSAAMP